MDFEALVDHVNRKQSETSIDKKTTADNSFNLPAVRLKASNDAIRSFGIVQSNVKDNIQGTCFHSFNPLLINLGKQITFNLVCSNVGFLISNLNLFYRLIFQIFNLLYFDLIFGFGLF